MTQRITFIGGGNMASALIGGMINSGVAPSDITVADPSIEQQQKLQQNFGCHVSDDNVSAINQSDIVVLAVKPQIMQQVIQAFCEAGANTERLFISVAAGITLARLQSWLGEKAQIIRTMPNTPALVGRGMTGLYGADNVTQSQRDDATRLMNAVGMTTWLEHESQINDIIALAGSAPAYFFMFMEAMQQHAITLGFEAEQARNIVQQVALGSAEMVAANPHVELGQLLSNVISKGGTTAEAIATFEQGELRPLTAAAMDAAIARAIEMEQLF